MFKKLLLLAATALVGLVPNADAETIFESATLGSTDQNGGTSLLSNQFLAVGFTLTETYAIDHVGGHIGVYEGTLFAAIIALPGRDQVPFSHPSSIEEDALAATVFTGPILSTDLLTPLSVVLGPGDYALVFGTGLFGADGAGGMAFANPDIGTPFYFSASYGGGWWAGGFNNSRFVVTGTSVAVPEPSALAMIGLPTLLGLVAGLRRMKAAA